MIHREATIKYKGYDPNDLKPHSSKRVCCVCDGCGRVRWQSKNGYRDFCHKCGHPTGENHSQYKKKIIIKCDNCDKEIKKYPFQIKIEKINNFCCKKCSNEYQSKYVKGKNHPQYKEKIILKCDNCDKEIKIYPYQINKHKHNFCNIKCSNEYFVGENASGWKGGISKQEYCYLFNESLKNAHRRYFNNKCFIDNEPEENKRALSVHHVGYDKRCGCNATQFCIFVPVKAKWNAIFNGNKEHNRWYWYSFLMNKIFIEHPNYFSYHIPVWGMSELEYNYDYVFEKFRRR